MRDTQSGIVVNLEVGRVLGAGWATPEEGWAVERLIDLLLSNKYWSWDSELNCSNPIPVFGIETT